MAASIPGSIEGTVVDALGRPAAGVTVMLKAPDRSGFDGAATTDASGVFRFDGLLAGHYVVAASREGGEASEAEVPVATGVVSRVELRLA